MLPAGVVIVTHMCAPIIVSLMEIAPKLKVLSGVVVSALAIAGVTISAIAAIVPIVNDLNDVLYFTVLTFSLV